VTKNDFVEYLFRRPEDVEWYFQDDHEDPKLTGLELVVLSGQVFEDIEEIARPFSERQLCMGLRYLIDGGCSSTCFSFLDDAVPTDQRLRTASSMSHVFEGLFAQHCKQTVQFANLLNGGPLTFAETCYLWWEIFPRHGVPVSPNMESTDHAILQTLEKILAIDNFACKESALHGLGHWAAAQPEEVETLIQRGLPRIPDVLVAYALNASKGNIQ
jgi:hypothetical protein